MKELGMALLGASCILGFFAFVIHPNLEYTGYSSIGSCTGECYEEYVALNGTPAVLVEALTGSVATAGSAKISGTVTITTTNPDSAQLKTINDAIDGTIVVPDKTVQLSGTATALAAALTGTVQDSSNDKITGTVTITGANPITIPILIMK